MGERAGIRRLALIAVLALAVAHGFAGAATHLPHHPGPALLAGAASAPQADGTDRHHHGHGGTACKMVSGSGGPHLQLGADGPAHAPTATPPAAPQCGADALTRVPPKPSLTALSVLRI